MKKAKKYIILISLAFIAVPVFMYAQSIGGITSNPCLVRIYHTNFPVGEGQIGEKDGELWYARTYLPDCEDSADDLDIIISGAGNTRINTRQQFGQGVVNFFIGNPCYVRVYHTDFAFPPEGGAIIQVGDELYFVPEYLPNCSSAASAGTVIRRGDTLPPANTPAQTGVGTIVNLLIGNPCLVPIYHTNFALNGGKIITIDGKPWYVKSYLPECANI